MANDESAKPVHALSTRHVTGAERVAHTFIKVPVVGFREFFQCIVAGLFVVVDFQLTVNPTHELTKQILESLVDLAIVGFMIFTQKSVRVDVNCVLMGVVG